MSSAPSLLPVARHALGVIAVALSLVSLSPLDRVDAAEPRTREPAGPRRSEARRLDRADVRLRDRAALTDLPSRTRIAYHAETGRVRHLAGSEDAPLSAGPASLAARRGRLRPREAMAAADRFLGRHGRVFGAATAGRDLRAQPSRTRIGKRDQ